MKAFERILFPVDFSDRCNQATCWAGEVARSLGSDLYLLHVYEGYDTLELGVSGRGYEDDVFKSLMDRRRKRLQEFGAQCFSGVKVHKLLRCGNAPEAIVSTAKEEGIDVVLMPTHGDGPFRRLLVGSVTLKVLHDSQCAVWTTAHTDTLPLKAPAQLRQILCAVDLSSESETLVNAAAKLGSIYGATVHLVHSVTKAEDHAHRECGKELDTLVAEAESELMGEGDWKRVCFETHVGAGQMTTALQSLARQLPADLIVVGHGHARKHFGGFWSHLGTIIHESPCSVLSV